jgi:endonuclease V-like protein UPF0215 family
MIIKILYIVTYMEWLLGIDDGPFKFSHKKVPIVGVIMRAPSYIECVCRSEVTVDGIDANEKLELLINSSNYKDQIRLIMFDGVALGGFNIIDIESLFKTTQIPITTITRTKPDMNLIKDTLKKHFSDWKLRWESIENLELLRIETNYNPIYIKHIGLEKSEVERLIRITTVRGALPEPIRVAHLIATALVKGESSGKA